MSQPRLADYLGHMRQAAEEACLFVQGLDKERFLADKRTQRATVMSLVIIGEAATKVMEQYCEFAERQSDVPWRSMRGMRNRIAHGYFDINLDVVWETVVMALPALSAQLDSLLAELASDAPSADDSKKP
jgi:uncharacterized protein with HEPN domain